jgi:hypothetical protein
VLLLLLLHKNTDYYTGQIIFEIMWLARKKTKFVDGKEIYGKTFIKVRSPVLPDF